MRTLTEKLKYNRFTLEFIRKFDTCDEDDYKLEVSLMGSGRVKTKRGLSHERSIYNLFPLYGKTYENNDNLSDGN